MADIAKLTLSAQAGADLYAAITAVPTFEGRAKLLDDLAAQNSKNQEAPSNGDISVNTLQPSGIMQRTDGTLEISLTLFGDQRDARGVPNLLSYDEVYDPGSRTSQIHHEFFRLNSEVAPPSGDPANIDALTRQAEAKGDVCEAIARQAAYPDRIGLVASIVARSKEPAQGKDPLTTTLSAGYDQKGSDLKLSLTANAAGPDEKNAPPLKLYDETFTPGTSGSSIIACDNLKAGN